MASKRLYERGPMREMPTVRDTDEAKRVGAIASHDETSGYPAIDRARDMIRKRVGMPPRSNGNSKPMRNGSDPPIKSKFE